MTATFWSIVSAMTLCVLGLLLRPLLKRTSAATSEQEKTLPVYRQQFSELEQDRAEGLLTDEQYQTAKNELERRVLEETGPTEGARCSGRRVRKSPVRCALLGHDHSGGQWRAVLDLGESCRDDASDSRSLFSRRFRQRFSNGG